MDEAGKIIRLRQPGQGGHGLSTHKQPQRNLAVWQLMSMCVVVVVVVVPMAVAAVVVVVVGVTVSVATALRL